MMNNRSSNVVAVAASALVAVALLGIDAHAEPPVTHAPFTYEIDYTRGQAVDPEFRGRFDAFAPDLYHGGSDLRYLGRYGFGATVLDGRDEPYERFLENTRAYLAYLRARGVRWVIPYLCNQTLGGNSATRYGAWEVYDRWDAFAGPLGLGERPSDPLEWMQREPFGALHYNYKRMVFLDRGMTAEDLRFAPCPNNPDWRRVCNAEARNAARAGYDGLFIDNCIIRCYCRHCEERFQAYLRDRYTPDTLGEAFGTRDYGQVVLHREGDAIQWALAQPEFIRWLEEKYPPEARRMPFDTTGALDLEHVAHAGSGMIIGEVSAFIAAQCLPPSVRPSFDAVRLANPALQTPAGRLRWAETCMFWAASIAEMLDEMGRAGREVSPDFFLVPNWGVMQRVNGAAGRAEEGKNTRLWKRGSTWHMFEEGYTTGRIAPGVVIEYDAELRFAFAHGVRAMLLPYTLAGQDVAEVGLAETAAAGGHVLVAIRQYPALYRTYREFFRDHASLYEGFRSAARVALAHCFDQTHYLNNEHLRCVAAINRYLADQQIPFDHVTEPDLRNPARLAAYRVVVLPALVFVDDAQRRAIRGYVESGGTVVLVGDFATHDERCRPTPGGIDVAADAANRVHAFASLDAALPHDGIYLEPALQAAESGGGRADDGELRPYRYLADIDRQLWFKRYQEAGSLTAIIADALGGEPSVLDPREGSGVRCHVYEKRDGDDTSMTVHLVNKNTPLAVPEDERVLQPVERLTVRLPLPDETRIRAVTLHQPGETSRDLTPDDDRSIAIGPLRAYAILAVDYERSGR